MCAGLLLVAMTVAAYLPALRAGFIWDDDQYVTANAALRSADGLGQIWLSPGVVPQYYPLTFTTFWLEYHLWGLQPFGYHLDNILLHALNALLLWRVLHRLGLRGAWVAAAVFALHPMQVESVAWITERKNVLSGLCYLAALLVYLRGVGATGTDRLAGRSYCAVCVLFLCALLSKTVTCTLPAVLLLLAWWRAETIDRRTVGRLLPLVAAGLALSGVTIWAERQRYHLATEGAAAVLSAVDRGLVAGRAWWFYPRTLLWPRALTFVYPRWAIDAHVWWQYLFPAAAVALLLVLYGMRQRFGRGPLVAALCYTVTLLPALGFFAVYYMLTFSFVADHFAYLAIIGLIALVIAAAAALVQRQGREIRIIAYAMCAAGLVTLGVLTARQCAVYRDVRTLWTDTLEKNPECPMAHNNLGAIVAAAGDIDTAIAHYLQALKSDPDFAEAHNNLGVALAAQGKIQEAVSHYLLVLRSRPDWPEAHNNLAIALLTEGKVDDAISHFEEAVRLRPDYAAARHNLDRALAAQRTRADGLVAPAPGLESAPLSAEAYTSRGNALRAAGKLDEAIAQYAAALRIEPADAEAHNNLGVALAMQGKTDAALRHFEQAVLVQPENAAAHANIGNVLLGQGKPEQAIAQYMEALRLQPANGENHNNLGVALLAQGNTTDAIAQFQEALRWNPDFAEARANLSRSVEAQQGPAGAADH